MKYTKFLCKPALKINDEKKKVLFSITNPVKESITFEQRSSDKRGMDIRIVTRKDNKKDTYIIKGLMMENIDAFKAHLLHEMPMAIFTNNMRYLMRIKYNATFKNVELGLIDLKDKKEIYTAKINNIMIGMLDSPKIIL